MINNDIKTKIIVPNKFFLDKLIIANKIKTKTKKHINKVTKILFLDLLIQISTTTLLSFSLYPSKFLCKIFLWKSVVLN